MIELYAVISGKVWNPDDSGIILVTRDIDKALEEYRKDQGGRIIMLFKVSEVDHVDVCVTCGQPVRGKRK